MSGPKSAQMILQNPTVDTAVFEVARGGILREGLGFDRNDVAVVTNVTGDHLGLGGIDTIRQLVERQGRGRRGRAAVRHRGPQRRRPARLPDGPRIAPGGSSIHDGDREGRGRLRPGRRPYVARRRGVRVEPSTEGEQIVLRHGPRTMPVLYTHLIPATFGGRARMNVANALAAAAAAWAAGAHLHDIRQGLRTFTTSFFQAPGRLNYLEVGGVRVVIDYCHNVDGMRNLADFVSRMMASAPTESGRIGAAAEPRRSGPGDRRHRHARRPTRRGHARVRRHRRAARSTRSSSARTRTSAADRRARRPPTSSRAFGRRGDGGTRPGGRRREKILDEMAAVRAALRRRDPGRPRRHVRGRRDRRLPRGDGRCRQRRAAGRHSPTPASSRRREG